MTQAPTVAVVVGRFQVSELHAGHRYLLEEATRTSPNVLVVLGSARTLPTARNPLSFAMRKAMIERIFPQAVVVEQFDHPSDDVWSKNLDALIEGVFPGCAAVLLGSRDSFFGHYSGKYHTRAVPELPGYNGTAGRRGIVEQAPSSPDFRAGVIYAETTRFPRAFPTVDVAILRPHTKDVLLAGKKIDGGKLRFFGGFVDPTDLSLERAAKREVGEEAGDIETDDYCYLGSLQVDDWRYRATRDKIITTFFSALYIFGAPRAGDDVDLVQWVPYDDVMQYLVPTHVPLGQMLVQWLAKYS